MSRRAIAAAFAAYFLIALAFGVVLQWAEPSNAARALPVFLERALSLAAAAYLVTGILPVAAWALRRFRAERAAGPLAIWGGLGIAYIVVFGLATLWIQKTQLSGSDGNITQLTDSVHDRIIRSINTGCTLNLKRSREHGQVEVTDQQIDAYCGCFSSALAKEVSATEIVYLASNGRPSPSFQEKADKVSPVCKHTALGQ